MVSTGGRALKKKVLDLLRQDDFGQARQEILSLPARQVVNPLFSFLLNNDERVRWRAVSAMGAIVSGLALRDLEAARVIMRRLMWSLNDESGGIGWGAPEAMGEIMARNEDLAREYSSILTSYLDEEGNFLEYEALRRGLLWGLWRLAQVRPDPVQPAADHISKYLDSGDPAIRGFSALLAGVLGCVAAKGKLEKLRDDGTEVRIYHNDHFLTRKVGELATEALERLEAHSADRTREGPAAVSLSNE